MKLYFYSWSKGEILFYKHTESNHRHLGFHVELSHVLISLLVLCDSSIYVIPKNTSKLAAILLSLNVVRILKYRLAYVQEDIFATILETGHVKSELTANLSRLPA